MVSEKKCQERVANSGGWGFSPCGRRRIEGSEFCGIHDPARREERRRKRGPSQFDYELGAIRARDRVKIASLKLEDMVVVALAERGGIPPEIAEQLAEVKRLREELRTGSYPIPGWEGER